VLRCVSPTGVLLASLTLPAAFGNDAYTSVLTVGEGVVAIAGNRQSQWDGLVDNRCSAVETCAGVVYALVIAQRGNGPHELVQAIMCLTTPKLQPLWSNTLPASAWLLSGLTLSRDGQTLYYVLAASAWLTQNVIGAVEAKGNGTVLWTYQAPMDDVVDIMNTPVALDSQGHIVYTTFSGVVGNVFSNGTAMWTVFLDAVVSSSVAIDGGNRLYFVTNSDVVMCLDNRDGSTIWTFGAGSGYSGSAGGVVFGGEGLLYASTSTGMVALQVH
jgi:outer membrane protein assembly factor BamB